VTIAFLLCIVVLYVSSPNGYVWQHFVCNICVAYSYIMFVLRINQHNAI